MTTISTIVDVKVDKETFDPIEMENICIFHNLKKTHSGEYVWINHQRGLLLFYENQIKQYSKYHRVVCLTNDYDLVDLQMNWAQYMETFERDMIQDLAS